MPGFLHPSPFPPEPVEEDAAPERPTTEAGWISLAMELCPPGEHIELHAAWCDVAECSCFPRVLRKPMAA